MRKVIGLLIFPRGVITVADKCGIGPYLKVLLILDATVGNAKSVNFSIVYTVSRDEVHRTGSMI